MAMTWLPLRGVGSAAAQKLAEIAESLCFSSKSFNRKKGHFILCLLVFLVFLALWSSRGGISGFFQPAQETKTIQRSLNCGLFLTKHACPV